MANREASDKDLCCAACGNGFIFSAGEQELFRLRGITTLPERCPSCVRGRGLVKPRTRGGSPDPSFG